MIVTLAISGLVMCGTALLAGSGALLLAGRRPRYRGRHRLDPWLR